MAAPPIPQGAITDRSTQTWVRATGRQVDLGEHPWLEGPFGLPDRIGDEWLPREAERLGGTVAEDDADAGLLTTMDDLKGPEFDPSSLRPEIQSSTNTRRGGDSRCGHSGVRSRGPSGGSSRRCSRADWSS